MRTLLYLCASLFFLAAAALLVTLGVYIPRVTSDLHQTMAVYQRAGSDLDQTAVHMDQVLIELRGATHSLSQAAASNQRYYQQIARQAAGTEKALRLFLDRTDRHLNGKTLPAIDQLVADLDKNSQDTLTAITATANEMGATAHALDERIDDPAVTALLQNLTRTSDNLSQTSQHTNQAMASVDRTVNYYEKRLTTPAGFAKRMAEWTLDTAAKVGEVFAGFVR